MLFSIIVPYFYKYDSYFSDCINSVLGQSFGDFECLIIACKSELQTLETHEQIVNKKVAKYESINLDQSSKRNVGINRARGEYIIFLDCDDVLDCRYLERAATEIQKNKNPDMVAFGFTREINKIGAFLKPSKLISGEDECRCEIFSDYMLEKKNTSKVVFDSSCWKIFKKELIVRENIRFQEGLKCAEDAIFVRNFSLFVKNIVVNDSYCSYFWRKNSKSTMNVFDSGFFDLEPFFINLKTILNYLPAQYSNNLNNYINGIILFRFRKALSLSKRGYYPLLKLIVQYKKSKLIRQSINILYFDGLFYRLVASSIKYKLFLLFKPILKYHIYRVMIRKSKKGDYI